MCITSRCGVRHLSYLLITHPFFLSLCPFISLPRFLSRPFSLCCRVLSALLPYPSFFWVPSPLPHPSPRTLCSGLLLPSCGRLRELQQDMAWSPFEGLLFCVKTIIRKTVGWTVMQIMIRSAGNPLTLACGGP